MGLTHLFALLLWKGLFLKKAGFCFTENEAKRSDAETERLERGFRFFVSAAHFDNLSRRNIFPRIPARSGGEISSIWKFKK